jgi:hypothetical protein
VLVLGLPVCLAAVETDTLAVELVGALVALDVVAAVVAAAVVVVGVSVALHALVAGDDGEAHFWLGRLTGTIS